MSPITHFLAGWLTANAAPAGAAAPAADAGADAVGGFGRRDRALVVAAGLLPDLDALGLVADAASRDPARQLRWWSAGHHVWAHNLPAALLTAGLVLLLARRRLRAALLAFAAFHLHLLGDLVGARGPDGESWPIVYFYPFTRKVALEWSGEWALNAWPNFVITGVLLALTLWLARRRGFSPVEMLSPRADAAVVGALRRRLPRKRP